VVLSIPGGTSLVPTADQFTGECYYIELLYIRLTKTHRIMYSIPGSNPVNPTITQSLQGLDTTRQYTLSFYYDLYTIHQSFTCTMTVRLANVIIYNKVFTVSDDPRPYNWKNVVSTAITPSGRQGTLTLLYACTSTSTQVTTQSFLFLDDFSLTAN
jgi:hypothetical protein